MTQKLRYFCTLLLMAVVGVAWADTGTITFSGSGVKINGANVTGDDNLGNTWTITTEGTTSFTSNTAYYQVGSSKNPATSITFTTTLSEDVNIESMSANFGGFSGTAGTITLKVGETVIGTGSLNATNDVTVNSNSTAVGKVLTITVTGISKGVKVYNISYTYSAASGDTPSISADNVDILYDATDGEIVYTINNPVEGGSLTASCEEDWIFVEEAAKTDAEGTISFICDANTVNTDRTATVTLTYSYGEDESVTKDVTVTQAAYVPKWTVSFDTDGGTFVANDDFAEEIVEVEQGTHYLPSATKDGYRLDGWNDGDATYAAGCGYDVTGDVEFTAVWVEKGVEEWVKTDISELEEGDVFVIVGNNGSDYAMTNDNGASAPLPVAVTVEDEKITSEVADNIMWNISGDATDGYTFYVNGDSEKWLYCTNANNGVRVGSGTNNVFTISDEGYLENVGTSRNVGIYNSQDWRCYSRSNGDIHSNIAGQVFSFYKKVVPSTTAKITIKDGFKATTFSCDKALDFTNVEGITANIITDENGTTKEVKMVPANTGLYIVRDDTDGEVSYEVPFLANEEEADPVTGNKLIPTDGTEFKSDEFTTYYAFGKQNGKEAFYKVPTSGFTPSANKAVLAIDAVNGAKEMIVIGGDVTGIESIENGTIVNDNYYTIDGKLVKGQPTQKGIYVVNGRKVVIK